MKMPVNQKINPINHDCPERTIVVGPPRRLFPDTIGSCQIRCAAFAQSAIYSRKVANLNNLFRISDVDIRILPEQGVRSATNEEDTE